ncbi:hypothetical protein KCU95_g12743, partial [Aureobasidium melanogenum]
MHAVAANTSVRCVLSLFQDPHPLTRSAYKFSQVAALSLLTRRPPSTTSLLYQISASSILTSAVVTSRSSLPVAALRSRPSTKLALLPLLRQKLTDLVPLPSGSTSVNSSSSDRSSRTNVAAPPHLSRPVLPLALLRTLLTMETESESPIAAGFSTDEPRTPLAVREILSNVGVVIEEAQDIIAKGFPGGEEILSSVSSSLTKATVRLLEKSHEYEAKVAQLEEQERARNAAANPLGEIPADLDPADTPAYLALIAQQLYQLQLRLDRAEVQQGTILQKLHDMEIVNQDLSLATAERLTENRTATHKDIRASCDEVNQSIQESRDAILEAQAARILSPPPSAIPNIKNRLRKRPADNNIRATSVSHRRKP